MLSEKTPDEIIVEDPMLSRAVSTLTQISVRVDENSSGFKWFRTSHDDYLVEKGIVDSKKTAASFRRDVALLIAYQSLLPGKNTGKIDLPKEVCPLLAMTLNHK